MESQKAALAEKRLSSCNALHRHPAAMAVAKAFGHRKNPYPATLRGCVTALFKLANKRCQDGYLTRRQALDACALDGEAPATARNRLRDLLTLTDHFAVRADGTISLKTQFLGEAKRAEAVSAWHRRKDLDALRKRRKRSSPSTFDVRRRRKFGPSDPPETQSVGGAENVRPVLESIKAIISISEVAQAAPAPARPPELPPPPSASASVAERRAWLAAQAAAETPEPAAKVAIAKPKPKPVARDEHGVPLCFYALGFVYFEGVWKRYTEAEWWRGYKKVKAGQRLGKQRGAAITYATRQIKSGAWQPAI